MGSILKSIFKSSGGGIPTPSTPVLLTPSVDTNEISIEWTMTSDLGITDYTVQYKKSSDISWTTFVRTASATKNTIIDDDLEYNTSYDIRVRAIDAFTQVSAWSNIETASTLFPFTVDSNTLWWDFRSTATNNVINTLGDDTMAYVYEGISGSVFKGLESPNKSMQPLIKTDGIDFNDVTIRRMNMVNTNGIANGTSGWYCAFNFKPTTSDGFILAISQAGTSTSVAPRGSLDFGGSRNIRVRIANNDGATLTTLGLTPALTLGQWYTVEAQVNISTGSAVMTAWVNGTLQTLTSVSTPTHTTTFLATNPRTVLIGNVLTESGTTSLDAEIQQMIFYNGVPSGGIRTSIKDYLTSVRPA